MFKKLGNYQNISEIRKTAITETCENENFEKKRLMQGPNITFEAHFLISLQAEQMSKASNAW
jgi:hypothetical protein